MSASPPVPPLTPIFFLLPGVSFFNGLLKGFDTNLPENLESFHSADYPNFEILCSVADLNDEGGCRLYMIHLKVPDVNATLL